MGPVDAAIPCDRPNPMPVIYPVGLTRGVQVALGIVVIAVNVAAYALFWRLRKKRR